MTDFEKVLAKHIEDLKNKPNVLSFRTDLTKIKNRKDTSEPCITVFVTRKVKRASLSRNDIIPQKIEDIPTDVIELDADYELNKTWVGELLPSQQKILMGVKKHG